MAMIVGTADYETLRDEIVQVLQEGKARAQRAVEEETLRTYHEIGHLLSDFLLQNNNDRADYGAQTVRLLADEVGMSQTLLYQTLAFFRLAPILHARVKLSWTHYPAPFECAFRGSSEVLPKETARLLLGTGLLLLQLLYPSSSAISQSEFLRKYDLITSSPSFRVHTE